MLHTHRAKVVGSGPFPVDMLRYDKCYPDTERDATAIVHSVKILPLEDRPTSVDVVQQHLSVRPNWTPERWATFGWTLGELS